MKKILITLALIIISSTLSSQAYAETYHASSAALTPQVEALSKGDDIRVKALTNVFEKHDSPLAPYAKDYIASADKYNVDWKLLPAISGLESSFGKALINGTYNAYGWGSGTIYFTSWADGIDTITKSLREDYMNKWKAKDVWEIGPIYAESPTWAVRVNHIMGEIDSEYITLSQAQILTPSLQ